MTTEAIETVDEVTGELLPALPERPVTLFGTDEPNEVLTRSIAIATSLGAVLRRKHLYATISGREYVLIEGWTLLGSMLGVFAEIEWTRPLVDGWEARAIAHTLRGDQLSAAESQCTRAERNWSGARGPRDDFALRSMAQTRAVAKALRMPLGFVIALAGYAATPAEEMPGAVQPQQARRGRPTVDELRAEIEAAAQVRRIGPQQLTEIAAAAGVEPGKRANATQLRAILDDVLTREEIEHDDGSGYPS